MPGRTEHSTCFEDHHARLYAAEDERVGSADRNHEIGCEDGRRAADGCTRPVSFQKDPDPGLGGTAPAGSGGDAWRHRSGEARWFACILRREPAGKGATC